MKPRDEEEENENKRLGRAKELKNGEDFHNQAGRIFHSLDKKLLYS